MTTSPQPRETDGGTSGRADRLLRGFSTLWQAGCLSDVTLESQDGRSFPVHRSLLAAASDYFFAMFTGHMVERDQEKISLQGVSAAGLDPLLTFLYTGELALSEDNVLHIISAAAHLQLLFALSPCVRFMAGVISIDNCVDIYNTAKMYELSKQAELDGCNIDIEQKSFDFITRNFQLVVAGRHQQRLDAETLLRCLTGKTEEGTDVIRYGPEMDLFKCVMEWKQAPEGDRDAEELLKALRYPLMTYADLDEVKGMMDKDSLTLDNVLEDAREYHALAMHHQVGRAASDAFRVRNRPCVVTLAHDGAFGNLSFFILSSPEGCPLPAEEKRPLTWMRLPVLDRNIHENVRQGFRPAAWVVVRGFLIVCGETEPHGHLRCYMFDSRTSLWAPMAVLNVPRTNCPLVECDGDLFSLGGVHHGSALEHSDVIERYSFERGRWELVGHMGESLRNHGACSLDGKIYMYGGRRQDGTVSQSMYTYTPSTDTWTERWYRFPLNDCPHLFVLLGRMYAADPTTGEMSYYVHSDRHDTWWGFIMRERHLVPVRSRHAVFLPDSVFFLGGILPQESNISALVPPAGSRVSKCSQVTLHKNRSMSGHVIPQPDYPRGWTPCVAAALSLPWSMVRKAKPVQDNR